MKRWLTALILLPPLIFTIGYLPNWCFVLLIVVVAIIALEEFFSLAKLSQLEVHSLTGHIYSIFLIISFHPQFEKQSYVLGVLCLATISFLFLSLQRKHQLNKILIGSGITLLGIFYVSVMLGFLVAIHSRASGTGPQWILFLLLVNWMGDTGAYYIGQLFGKRKLAARISPKKTWAGSVGGLIGNTLAVIVGQYFFLQTGFIELLFLGWVLGVLGQLGDLIESAMKRSAHLKDSSNLLPGHGGILDRIDSILLGAPVLFFYLLFFE